MRWGGGGGGRGHSYFAYSGRVLWVRNRVKYAFVILECSKMTTNIY